MTDILFLEDDKLLAQSVVEELEDASYSVKWVQEGDEAAQISYDNKYYLYLFDVNVPGINGFELLSQLRKSGDMTPAIFLTSKNQINDLRKGFEVGAADYIKKPFDLHELLIRIESKMPKKSKVNLSVNLAIEASTCRIICKGVEKKLPLKEFQLLEYFCKNQDLFLSPYEIISAIYGDTTISIATFRTYIKNIKRHLEGCVEIENMKGVGYRFKLL